jgi:hypothetical protein
MAVADYYWRRDHEAASKFLGQSHHQAKYSAAFFSTAVVDCASKRFRAKWLPVRVKKTRQKKSF